MTGPGDAPKRRAIAPFQFTVATALTVVTGVSILLSLVMWDPSIGGAVAIPVVGTWWTAAAVKAGWRRLAYYLASVVIGVVVHLILVSPINLVGEDLLCSAWGPEQRLHWQPGVLTICAALGTAAILRPWIRKPGKLYPMITGLVATYLGAALYGWGFLVWHYVWRPDLAYAREGIVSSMLVLVPAGSVIVGTTCIYWPWPAAIAACSLLRRIDPKARRAVRAFRP